MSSKARILVVDDEANIRRTLEMALSGEGFDVRTAPNGEEALALIREDDSGFAAMFLDVKLPGIDGLEVLARLREEGSPLAVVMISGHATVERAVEATRLGAFDFVEKPFSRERILLLARNATQAQQLKVENRRLRGDDEMIGDSPAMTRLKDQIEQVAPTDARVLISGESGSGKELVAKRLHERSRRAAAPFLKLNCAAIPDDLIEAELFGAVKGAYTGADRDREGLFASADGGTLLLDEIGDMSLRAQAKVLRVLQEGEVERLGSTQTQKVDVRVLAATHQDLESRVRSREFREDLFFRLNVVPLHVPALRERQEDVPRLVEHFLEVYGQRHDRPHLQLDEAAASLLRAHAWPGNIRELANVVERLVILSRSGRVTRDDLPTDIRGAHATPADLAAPNPYANLPLREAKQRLETDLISAALQAHEGNVTRAAKALGLERTHLHKRIRALGIESA